MLEALRVETARVRMTLVRYDEEGNAQPVPVDPPGSKYLPQPNEFVYLRTSITNHSRESTALSQSRYPSNQSASSVRAPTHAQPYPGAVRPCCIPRRAPGHTHRPSSERRSARGGDSCGVRRMRPLRLCCRGARSWATTGFQPCWPRQDAYHGQRPITYLYNCARLYYGVVLLDAACSAKYRAHGYHDGRIIVR